MRLSAAPRGVTENWHYRERTFLQYRGYAVWPLLCARKFELDFCRKCFMQLAILLVLILIAVLIAPWLIGVVIAAAAVYGVYLVAAFAIAGIAIVVVVIWALITEKNRKEKPEEIHGERKACMYCQAEMAASATRCKNCGESSA
jgi:ribosomal protein L40E